MERKIDPALDTLVKAYVAFLDQLERSPNEGQLTLPDDLAKTVSKRLAAHDLGDIEAHRDFFSYVTKTGMLQNNDLDTFLQAIQSFGDYDKTLTTCFKLVESLPEKESRQFYTTKLNYFKDDPTFKPDSEVINSSN